MANKRKPIPPDKLADARRRAAEQIQVRDQCAAYDRMIAGLATAVTDAIALYGKADERARSVSGALKAALRERPDMNGPPELITLPGTTDGSKIQVEVPGWMDKAMEGETLEDATARILLEGGATAYQLATGADVEARVNGAVRKRMDRLRDALVNGLSAMRDGIPLRRELAERVARLERGEEPAGPLRLRVAREMLANAADNERRRADIETRIAVLNVDSSSKKSPREHT